MSNTVSPQKSRVLLMIALTKTIDQEGIHHYFDTHKGFKNHLCLRQV